VPHPRALRLHALDSVQNEKAQRAIKVMQVDGKFERGSVTEVIQARRAVVQIRFAKGEPITNQTAIANLLQRGRAQRHRL
jgi:hypothetical protein